MIGHVFKMFQVPTLHDHWVNKWAETQPLRNCSSIVGSCLDSPMNQLAESIHHTLWTMTHGHLTDMFFDLLNGCRQDRVLGSLGPLWSFQVFRWRESIQTQFRRIKRSVREHPLWSELEGLMLHHGPCPSRDLRDRMDQMLSALGGLKSVVPNTPSALHLAGKLFVLTIRWGMIVIIVKLHFS